MFAECIESGTRHLSSLVKGRRFLTSFGMTSGFETISPALLVVMALSAGACDHRAPASARTIRAQQGHGDVVVGAAWPWSTRTNVRYGQGLDMAVDEVNAGGGIDGRRLVLRRVDDHESVNDGRMAAQQLGEDPDVVAVIGHLQSFVTVPAAAIYDAAGLVLLAPTATDPELTRRGSDRVFRMTFTDSAVGRHMADVATGRGYRRIGIYYIRNAYGRELANAFEERAVAVGASILARGSYDASGAVSGQTFEPVLREWAGLNLDAIFLAGEVPSAAVFVAEARREGVRLPIIGGDALGSPDLARIAGPAAEGALVASAFHPDEPRAEAQRFRTAFHKRFGVDPDAGSALGYDAVGVLVAAMRQAHSTVPAAVAAALHSRTRWEGVTGQLAFDGHGDLIGVPVVTMIVRNGAFAYLADPASVHLAAAGVVANPRP